MCQKTFVQRGILTYLLNIGNIIYVQLGSQMDSQTEIIRNLRAYNAHVFQIMYIIYFPILNKHCLDKRTDGTWAYIKFEENLFCKMTAGKIC